MGSRTQEVIFLGSGRCYHTMDWFRSAQALRPQAAPTLVTDLIEGESFERLVAPSDRVERLMVIDAVLLKKQSRAGDIWRNLVKLLLLPIQAVKLRGILRRYEAPVVHAHSMYYVAMARLASCSYVATPQGSEVLVRPFRSRAYRAFSRFALAGASRISVDSDAMQRVIRELFGLDSTLVQNGIDIGAIRRLGAQTGDRDKLVSIRGLTENYRIREILDARNVQAPAVPLHFCYPFSDAEYVLDLEPQFVAADRNLGRLSRGDLYRLLVSAVLVLSVPVSDSSPRSVYEAIFCGAFVATTKGEWMSQLPTCMIARLITVDLSDGRWLSSALEFARARADTPYVPSPEALALFDQGHSMSRFYEEIYPSAVPL